MQICQSEPPINHGFLKNVLSFPSNSKSIPTLSTSYDPAFSYWTKKSEVTRSKLSPTLSFCTLSSIASYLLFTILDVFIFFPFRIINYFPFLLISSSPLSTNILSYLTEAREKNPNIYFPLHYRLTAKIFCISQYLLSYTCSLLLTIQFSAILISIPILIK